MTLGRLGEKSVKSSVLEVTVQVGGKEGDPGKEWGELDPGGEGHQVLCVRGGGHAAHLDGGEEDPGETGGKDHEVLGVRGDGQAVQFVGGEDDTGETDWMLGREPRGD